MESTIPSGTIKYKYTSLSQMSNSNEYNFFGIVIDSSFPLYKKVPSPHYECILKIIDDKYLKISSNLKTVIIKAKNKNQIPYIKRLGSIIRVIYGTFKNNSKIYLNFQISEVNQKASWCIFDNESYIISQASNLYYTMQKEDKEIITSLSDYFNNLLFENLGISSRNAQLINRKENDRDSLVLVVGKAKNDDHLVLFIQDETDACELHVFNYFDFIMIGDVIRIRSYRIYNNNVLVLNEWGNLLIISKRSKIYKNCMNKIIHLYNSKYEKEQIPLFLNENISQETELAFPDITTESLSLTVVNPPLSIRQTSITDLFEKENKFISIFSIISIIPTNPILNCVNIMCLNCQNSFNISEIELNENKFKCIRCNIEVEAKIFFNMAIYVREKEEDDELIKLHLCDYDDEGRNFLGISAKEVLTNGTAIKIMEKNIKKIMNEKSRVKLLLERNEDIYRIIGQYEYV